MLLVSRALAERTWPNASPLGRQIRLAGLGDAERWRTVVGVVDDVLLGNPLSRDRRAIAAYIPLRQTSATAASVVFRHRGGRQAGQSAFHQVLSRLDPLIAPSLVQSFEEVLAKTTLIARSDRSVRGLLRVRAAARGQWHLCADGPLDRPTQGGRQLGAGALVALPLTLLAGLGFSHFFPISFGVALAVALLVAATVTSIVLAATWVPSRQAVSVEPRDALWRE